MKKRRAFAYILLELIIALTLLTLVLLPFINIPSNTARQEVYSLFRTQLQQVADNTCALIKERIYTKEITWEQILHPEVNKALVLDDTVTLPFAEFAKQSFSRKCYLFSSGKKGPAGEEYRFVRLEVVLQKKPNEKPFFFRKKKKEQSKDTLKFTYKMVIAQGQQPHEVKQEPSCENKKEAAPTLKN